MSKRPKIRNTFWERVQQRDGAPLATFEPTNPSAKKPQPTRSAAPRGDTRAQVAETLRAAEQDSERERRAAGEK